MRKLTICIQGLALYDCTNGTTTSNKFSGSFIGYLIESKDTLLRRFKSKERADLRLLLHCYLLNVGTLPADLFGVIGHFT